MTDAKSEDNIEFSPGGVIDKQRFYQNERLRGLKAPLPSSDLSLQPINPPWLRPL